LEKSEENIAGVLIPALAVREFEDNENAMSQIGLERGGHSIQKCREKFRTILTLLVDIAGLQVLILINKNRHLSWPLMRKLKSQTEELTL